MATTTDSDLTAADVAWDLEPLVDGKGEAGVDELLDEADRVAASVAERRGTHRRSSTPPGSPRSCASWLRSSELVGRAASYASLRFAADTTDPGRGALLAARRGARNRHQHEDPLLRARMGGAARRSGGGARRRRAAGVLPPLPRGRRAATDPISSPSPRSVVMTEKAVTGRSAWSRLFSELTSTIAVDLDGGRVSLEEALSRLQLARSRRASRRGRGGHRLRSSPACGRGRSCSTPCWPTRRSTTACASTRTGSPAGTSTTRPATNRCRRSSPRSKPGTTSRSAGTRSRRGCSGSTGSPTTTAWRRWRAEESEFGWREARELVLDAYGSFSLRARGRRAPILRRGVDRRPGPARQAPGRVLRVHRPVATPVPAAELDRPPPRRADARPRARPWAARVPGARSGRLPPDDAAHAGRDRLGVRRDRDVRPAARGDQRSCGPARAPRREHGGPDRDRLPPDRR